MDYDEIMTIIDQRINEREQQLIERVEEMVGAIKSDGEKLSSGDVLGYGDVLKRAEVRVDELLKLKRLIGEHEKKRG